MNEALIPPESSDQPIQPPLMEDAHPTGQSARWLSHFVRCNPFYLASALLLIYGLYRVAIDPHFLRTEIAQVLFNFGAIELYEAMLAATALALMRRRITYDSHLLFWLENLLVVIPFMLVSHAVFLGPSLAWVICACGLLLVSGRFLAFRRWFTGLPLSAGLLALGALVLLVNVALPLTFRQGLETNNELWSVRSQYCWRGLLPILFLLGNLLPRPMRTGPERDDRNDSIAGFGLAAYGLWIAGTAVHLFTIGYVDEQKFAVGDLSVLLWAAAWMVCHRITDFIPHFQWREKLLLAAPAATVLALATGDLKTFFWLSVLNAGVLGGIFVQARLPLAAGLATVSGLAALLSIPPEATALAFPGYTRPQMVVGILGLIGLYGSVRRPNPKWGFLGALSLAILIVGALWKSNLAGHVALQGGCVYFLLHALLWNGPQEKGTNLVLSLVSICWTIDALCLLEPTDQAGASLSFVTAGIAAGGLIVGKLVFGRQCWFAVGATLGVIFARPGVELALWIQRTPAGLLAILASFLLFVLGTLFALYRSKNRRIAENRPV